MKPEKIGTLSDLTPATRKEFIDAKNALEKAKGTGMENTKPAGERYFKAKNTVDKELFAEEIKTKSQLTDIWNKGTRRTISSRKPVSIKVRRSLLRRHLKPLKFGIKASFQMTERMPIFQ